MRNSGINMSQMKKNNRGSILRYINEKGPVSRKDIAEGTGLTPAAVTVICADLMAEGMLTELGTADNAKGVGRKKVLVDLNYNYCSVLTINMDSNRTVCSISNLKGECRRKETIPTDASMDATLFLKNVAELCKQMLAEEKERQESLQSALMLAGKEKLIAASLDPEVKVVSMVLPGLVDKEKGISIRAYGIWEEAVPVADILKKELGFPVILENNVNAFALAEILFGEGRQYEQLLLIKWGPGVGSTIIVNSQIYEGRHKKAAEIGHIIIEPEGRTCSCGRRGCLETLISYQALAKQIPFEPDKFGSCYEQLVPKGGAKSWERAIDVYARTIVNSMTLLAPDKVILFGKLFDSEVIQEALRKACKSYDSQMEDTQIAASSLSDKEDYIGPVAVYLKMKCEE